jgi:hypothetical protein
MYVFLELCQQAKLYAVIATLLLLYSVIKNPEHSRRDMVILLIKAVVFIGWTFALNKLCTSGYKYIAWLAALVPHLIYVLFLINF